MSLPSVSPVAVSVVILVVLTGCVGIPDIGNLGQDNDTIGHEGGYGVNDSLSVTTTDGLNQTEREAVVARTMARVEAIRGLEFTRPVPVRVISRAEYRNRSGRSANPDYVAWNNQVWEALFLVDERTNASDALSGVYGSAVLGYYSNGEIVIVSDSETPHIDRATLAHELTHALQAQQLTLGDGTRTQDAQLAENGLVEGDANYVEAAYENRCGEEWNCLPRRTNTSSPLPDDVNHGVYMTVVEPYVDGPSFVAALRERGGWSAVNAAYDDIPESTEQIIHPATYPDEDPVNVTVPDRSSGDWERFDIEPQADTVGEASIYTTFWTNGVVNRSHQQYNYSQPLSAGWAGDSLVPYRNDGRYGYVWKTRWDTERDAREFVDGYRELLERRGAHQEGDAYVIPEDSPYGDAFRVIRDGRTVIIVNAPTIEELDQVRRR